MYDFVSGPLFWVSIALFIGGSIYQIVSMLLNARKDKVVYPYMRLEHSARSLRHWLVPFGTRSMRTRPTFTVISFVFHICLLVTPLFVLGHHEMLGISIIHLSDGAADAMTLMVLFGGLFFLQRRLLNPCVNYVTFITDYLLLLVVMAPFLTGLLAYHQWFGHHTMTILHMVSGELMLVVIPFTRISHMLFFLFTRSYMACEFGFVRNSKDW
jgi:nitrate reductase gamma subunit